MSYKQSEEVMGEDTPRKAFDIKDIIQERIVN